MENRKNKTKQLKREMERRQKNNKKKGAFWGNFSEQTFSRACLSVSNCLLCTAFSSSSASLFFLVNSYLSSAWWGNSLFLADCWGNRRNDSILDCFLNSDKLLKLHTYRVVNSDYLKGRIRKQKSNKMFICGPNSLLYKHRSKSHKQNISHTVPLVY